MGLFHTAYRAIQRINSALVAVSYILIGLITVLTLWEVITRYFFRQPATWTFPITSYMLLYSIMFAAAYTLQRGGHVRVEVLVEILPQPVRRAVERVAHVLGAVFVLVLVVQSTRHSLRLIQEGDRDISTLSVPLWIPSVGMTLGVFMLAVTYVVVVVDAFSRAPEEPTVQEQQKPRLRARVDTD